MVHGFRVFGWVDPEGPCAQIVHTSAPTYIYGVYFIKEKR